MTPSLLPPYPPFVSLTHTKLHVCAKIDHKQLHYYMIGLVTVTKKIYISPSLMQNTFDKCKCAELDCFHFVFPNFPSVTKGITTYNVKQLLSREVESPEQAARTKNMLCVYPHCPLCCWRPGWPPVCVCILYPSASPALPMFLHISTSSFHPSFA